VNVMKVNDFKLFSENQKWSISWPQQTQGTVISDRDHISLLLPFYVQCIHCPSHTILEIWLGNLPCEFNELLNDSDDFEHGHLRELASCKHTDVFLGGRVW